MATKLGTYPMNFTIHCNGEAIASVTANIPLHVHSTTVEDGDVESVDVDYQALQQHINDAVQAFDKALEAT